jgi:hypothetical protein
MFLCFIRIESGVRMGSVEIKERELRIGDVNQLWFEYDRQTDILYINFGYDIE